MLAQQLGADQRRIAEDDQLTGYALETFCGMEILKHQSWACEDSTLRHYRVDDDEIDIVLESQSGDLALIEVKARASVRERDWRVMKKLRDRRRPLQGRRSLVYRQSDHPSWRAHLGRAHQWALELTRAVVSPVAHSRDVEIENSTETVGRRDWLSGLPNVAMPELHRRFDELQRAQAHHPLLLLGAYVFDFLVIHPFQDGNGRTARLITLLLLYQSGHEIGRYISLERIINDTRETYYKALGRSTDGWHDGQHTIWPWTEYLMGTLLAAYNEFEQRLEMTAGYGTKQPAIRDYIRSRIVNEFSLDDVRSAIAVIPRFRGA